MIELTVNGTVRQVEVEAGTPLLWVLREQLGLTGTKYGCGIAQCGACTVLVDGQATRSCSLPVEAAVGQPIVTIEAIEAHPVGAKVVEAWVAAQAPQCGYCQSGQIMTAAALLKKNPKPTREQIKTEMNGNICRCGTYNRIVRAIERASKGA